MDLSDEEWAAINPFLPAAEHGPARVDDRRVLTGFLYILRTGAPWRDLPDRYGPRTTVYNRYNRWAQRVDLEGDIPCLGARVRRRADLHRRQHRQSTSGFQRLKKHVLSIVEVGELQQAI